MAIFIAQARVGIALLQIDEPALDAIDHDVIFWNGVSRTIELADVAVEAEILHAELAGAVFYKRQIGGDKAGAKAGAVLFVDHAAVASELTEPHLVKNRESLNLAPAVMMGTGGVAEIADVRPEVGGDLGALGVGAHRFLLHRVGTLGDLFVVLGDA